MDKIKISNLRVFAYHGVNPEEKRDGQLFVLDITAHIDLSKAAESDDLNDTVSYAKMIKTARRVMQSKSNNLLESTAQQVIDALFEEFPPIQEVEVLLKKPDAPIKADFDWVAVELCRKRGEK